MRRSLVRILTAVFILSLSTVNIWAMETANEDSVNTSAVHSVSPFIPDVPKPVRIPASLSSPFIPDVPEPRHYTASPESPFIPDLPEPIYPIASPQSPFIPDLPMPTPFFPVFF